MNIWIYHISMTFQKKNCLQIPGLFQVFHKRTNPAGKTRQRRSSEQRCAAVFGLHANVQGNNNTQS